MPESNDDTQELWRPIEEFPMYEVSSHGRIRRDGRIKATHVYSRRPWMRVTLYQNSAPHYRAVHVLVANAFLGEKPHGQSLRFKDKDTTNPRLSNLEYRRVDTLPVKIPGRRPRA